MSKRVRKLGWVDRIEAEYGEPIRDTILSYVKLGYSQQAIQEVLEITWSQFYHLTCKLGIRDQFLSPKDFNEACRKAPGGTGKQFTTRELLDKYLPGDTIAEFVSRTGISVSTIWRYFTKWSSFKAMAERDRRSKCEK